jgi:hypothetical protein
MCRKAGGLIRPPMCKSPWPRSRHHLPPVANSQTSGSGIPTAHLTIVLRVAEDSGGHQRNRHRTWIHAVINDSFISPGRPFIARNLRL